MKSKPRNVLVAPNVTAFAAAVVVPMVGDVPPVAGSATLCAGTLMPEMVAMEAVAPWPINSWPLSSVNGPLVLPV